MTHERTAAHGTESIQPLVSVVIPTYNHASFLGEAVASVQAQSYGSLEVVVVDDGSTDETPQVVAALQGVKYVAQANQGLASARNTGIRCSQGSYLLFLDADDRLLPNAVRASLARLAKRPECAFVSGSYTLVDTAGALLHRPQRSCPASDHFRELLRANYIGMHATVLYRRSALEEVGGFDAGLKACEDYDLYLRIARRWPVLCHAEEVAEYRQHGDNMSGNPALMLTTALAALAKQHGHVRSDRTLLRAWREGRAFYRAFYGKRLADESVKRARTGRLTGLAAELAVLARFYPRGLVRIARSLFQAGRAAR